MQEWPDPTNWSLGWTSAAELTLDARMASIWTRRDETRRDEVILTGSIRPDQGNWRVLKEE